MSCRLMLMCVLFGGRCFGLWFWWLLLFLVWWLLLLVCVFGCCCVIVVCWRFVCRSGLWCWRLLLLC